MGAYSVPAEIRNQKPKGTMVKRIGDKFYVYEYSTSKIRVSLDDGTFKWKTKTKMGKCIGSITEETGYVPNITRINYDDITAKNYGSYAFVVSHAQSTLSLLKEVFCQSDAEQIFVVATIFFVDGFTYMKNAKGIYEMSYLSSCYPNINVGYKALRTLYENLGTRQAKPKAFEQMLIKKSSGMVAIDGHVIACTSEMNDLSEFGYKASKLGTEQVNWLTAYDVISKTPLLSQLYSGAEPDKIAVKALFDRYSFSNTEFLVDRGFNSADDKALMSKSGNTYIVPMISTHKDYKYVLSNLKFDKSRYFTYNKNSYTSMIYYQELSVGEVRCFAFQDTTRASAEKQDYIKALDAGKRGYDEEGLVKSESYFGLFLLETNNYNLSAQEVFCHYKERWTIETYYNYIRNDVDFNALYQQDYFSMQGLGFIVSITGMIYHDIKDVADRSKLRVKDIICEMSKLKMVYEGNKWLIRNNIKSVRELCEKTNFSIPDYIT